MKIEMKFFLWSIWIISASHLLAEDIIFSRVTTQNDGKKLTSEYTVSADKAASFPKNPLTEGILLSFEDALGIAAKSATDKWQSEQIVLTTAHFSFSISKPRFHFWVFQFAHFPEGQQRRLLERVVVLPDGSVVEPTIEQSP